MILSFLGDFTLSDNQIKLLAGAIVIVILFLIFMSTDKEDNPIDINFTKYLKNHTSGSYLKDIYLGKEYIILEEEFFDFDNNTYYINDIKKEFLLRSSMEYNIIVYTSTIYGTKYLKLVEYCRSLDLPICRIVDLKPSAVISNKKTLKDGSIIYYYTRDKKN